MAIKVKVFYAPLLAIFVISGAWITAFNVLAAGTAPQPPKQDWSFSGMFGTFDRPSTQRGLQVYREVCAGCHSLKQVDFRHLAGIGYSENQIKAFAAEADVVDGPNDEGEMFERPGIPADQLPNPYPNKKAAAASNNGKAPPDLSLMTKARFNGPDYVYALLTGYVDAPPELEVPDGGNYNTYYPGHIIAMANPLVDDGVEYQDGTKASIEQQARDVTTFLSWTAEPELEARKALGIKVLIFLIILTALLYRVKKVIWRDVQ
ncbi:MAG: cytochrome c1 [Rhodospirillaceae bacterium TMED8]|nr:cytochrome c1 [Magnetovibrio sp.]OUT47704.1 MAG: cytochrome c1 [Rhodospirillaceae bacterium TMED8]|tara:strand:+ start:2337 stop:3122 length:786 start_codon:yes stop_codon:yes gene_type:complete